jgi:hypothetical protein
MQYLLAPDEQPFEDDGGVATSVQSLLRDL